MQLVAQTAERDFRFWAQFIRKPVKYRVTQSNFNPQRTVLSHKSKANLVWRSQTLALRARVGIRDSLNSPGLKPYE